jgi:hypothetical protein
MTTMSESIDRLVDHARQVGEPGIMDNYWLNDCASVQGVRIEEPGHKQAVPPEWLRRWDPLWGDPKNYTLEEIEKLMTNQAPPPLPPHLIQLSRERLLREAIDTITRDRNEEYGGPENSFKLIADFWNVYLDAKRSNPGVMPSITAGDVALMMDLLKTARLITNPKHVDSVRDKAGYLGCYADVMKIYEG